MGGPKALMDVGGRPWWRWQVERLEAAGMASVWVVNDAVIRGMSIHPDAPRACCRADGTAPMFHSLMGGIRSLGSIPAFVHVLPVDVPCPKATTFASLERGAGMGVAVPTRAGSRGHPACLAGPWIARHLLDASGTSESRLDVLIRGSTTEVEIPDDPDATVNLNTSRDVEAWLATWSSSDA